MNTNEQFQYLGIGLPDRIARRKAYGDFDGAIRLIDQILAEGKGSEGFRACLNVQREQIVRLPLDYPFTFDEAVAFAQQQAPDFTADELRALEEAGRIDWIYINGVPHYFNRFFENLCEVDKTYAVRAGLADMNGDNDGIEYRLERMAVMKERGGYSQHLRIKARVRIKDEAFRPGERVMVHLPLPAACEEQSDIRIERMFPENGAADAEDAPQRTICWQETMTENHPFEVEYSYTYTGRYVDAWNAVPDAQQPDFFTEEIPPHIMFTPYIRDLVKVLSEGAENNLEKAQRFYKFVTENVKYSFSRAYFGLESIADSCARNLVGDCGIQATLFITLCRCAGIPARWESGLAAGPVGNCGAHDWAKVYIAPLGWFPVDLSRGGTAFARGKEELQKFYFGNLECDRMVANRTVQADFGIPKQHWRADPYDNQVGEIETAERALDYSEYDRSKETLACDELPL